MYMLPKSRVHFRPRPSNLYSARRRVLSSVKRAVKTRTATKNKTKTRTRIKHTPATEMPGRSGTESYFRIKLRPTGIMSKVAAKAGQSTYTINYDQVQTAATGEQGAYSDYHQVLNAGQLRNVLSQAFTQSAAIYGSKTVTAFVKSAWMEVMIQNSTNAIARLQIWDCMAKRDMYQDSVGANITPTTSWKQGLSDQASTPTGDEYKVVGSRPTDSKLFNLYWKPKKVTYVDLAPGQVHYHRINYIINRPINREIVLADTSTVQFIKGWTLVPMIVSYGEPVGDNVGGCTTTAVRLNTISSLSIKYSQIEASASYSVQTNQLAITTTGNLENLVTGASSAFAAVT